MKCWSWVLRKDQCAMSIHLFMVFCYCSSSTSHSLKRGNVFLTTLNRSRNEYLRWHSVFMQRIVKIIIFTIYQLELLQIDSSNEVDIELATFRILKIQIIQDVHDWVNPEPRTNAEIQWKWLRRRRRRK